MHKEVNRSMIRWPAAASATILAVSWFPMGDDAERATPPLTPQISVTPRIAAVLETHVVIPQPEVDQTERGERGTRAMKLPTRIAEAFGVTQSQEESGRKQAKPVVAVPVAVAVVEVEAPVRRIEQELAGLEFKKAGDRSASLASDSAEGDTEVDLVIADETYLQAGHTWLVDPMQSSVSQADRDLDCDSQAEVAIGIAAVKSGAWSTRSVPRHNNGE